MSNNYKKIYSVLRGCGFTAVIFLVGIILFIMGIGKVQFKTEIEGVKILEKGIRRAAVQCYAIEGMYPSDIKYLEKNYGLIIDHDKYFIDYCGFASNLMPDIIVIPR